MKIKVNVLESKSEIGATEGTLEMVPYRSGLINLGGRSLPF